MNNFISNDVSLDVLDTESVLEVTSKNVLGFKKRFKFFNAHFEYKNFLGRKRKVYYSLIEKIYYDKNKIKIKLYGKMFAITLCGVENSGENYEKLKKLTGF
ncbi:MAG: hypothetical protein BWK68_00185 [Elusimicrobia bacterium A5]|nr:MAG: hypothetical protein BWK68_00185 [Elusimicrobia bacterium A5]